MTQGSRPTYSEALIIPTGEGFLQPRLHPRNPAQISLLTVGMHKLQKMFHLIGVTFPTALLLRLGREEQARPWPDRPKPLCQKDL